MKKIDTGQTIAIIANLGVIASIAFLAYELRQNNEALDAQSRYSHAIGIVDFFADMSLDEDLSAIIVKGQQSLDELTPTEEFRLQNHYLRIFTMWQWEFYEDRLGRIDAPIELWLTLIRGTPDETGFFYPGMQGTWETQKRIMSRDFRQFIDSRLADAAQE